MNIIINPQFRDQFQNERSYLLVQLVEHMGYRVEQDYKYLTKLNHT